MEIVFVGNLLEATKDLEDGEILFCPIHDWASSLSDSIGGVVEDDGRVRLPTLEELYSARDHLLLRGSAYKNSFFYAYNPEWMRKNWEELSKEIKKNEEYLKKEVVEDLIYVDPLFEYDLFINISSVTNSKNSEALKLMVENTRAIVEGEVREKLIEMEKEKREKYEKYIEGLIRFLEFSPFNQPNREINLNFTLPSSVRKKGTKNYIKGGKRYKEATRGKKRVMIIQPDNHLIYGSEMDEIRDGIGVKYLLSKPKIDRDRVYVVLGEFKIRHVGRETNYLLGLPFFKVKFSSVNNNVGFRSRNVSIRRREETGGAGGVVRARLQVKDFRITLEYAKEPEEKERNKWKKETIRTIKTDKTLRVDIIREDRVNDATSERYKVCDIEIQEDGGFSVEMNYRNSYKVKITASKKAAREANEIAEEESKKGVFWLIEKWTKGKKTIGSGKIMAELLDASPTDEKKVFVLKEGKDEIGTYIKSRLEEVIKNIIKEKEAEDKKEINRYSDKERNFNIILLKPEEHGEIIREIQTGFIQDKVMKNLKYLEKIEELCFESKEGERIGVKHPDLEKEEELTKRAREVALYGTGINVEKLKGEKKSITEVLKFVSYSFPFLTKYNLETILGELGERVNLALSKDMVPLKEIDVSIGMINTSSHLSSREPRVLALFSIEGDKVKVYINDGKEQRNTYINKVTEHLKIGIGNIEITV